MLGGVRESIFDRGTLSGCSPLRLCNISWWYCHPLLNLGVPRGSSNYIQMQVFWAWFGMGKDCSGHGICSGITCDLPREGWGWLAMRWFSLHRLVVGASRELSRSVREFFGLRIEDRSCQADFRWAIKSGLAMQTSGSPPHRLCLGVVEELSSLVLHVLALGPTAMLSVQTSGRRGCITAAMDCLMHRIPKQQNEWKHGSFVRGSQTAFATPIP